MHISAGLIEREREREKETYVDTLHVKGEG